MKLSNLFYVCAVLLFMSMLIFSPSVTAQFDGITYRTVSGSDTSRLLTILNDPNNRNSGLWCDTSELTSVDLLGEWSKQSLIRQHYIVSVGQDSEGNIKTVVEGWVFDDDKFLFKSVVWDAQGIPEREYSVYIHNAVKEVVRQVKRLNVTELHVSATEGTFIYGYVEFLSQYGTNIDNYSYYMTVENFDRINVNEGLVFPYAPSNKRTSLPIDQRGQQLDDTTWIKT